MMMIFIDPFDECALIASDSAGPIPDHHDAIIIMAHSLASIFNSNEWTVRSATGGPQRGISRQLVTGDPWADIGRNEGG